MSATITIACPECDKQLSIRAELEGKKVRCKDCGCTFTVRAPARKSADVKKAPDPKKAVPQPAAKPGRSTPDDDFDDKNPYVVTHEELGHRCPHCAAELETEDAVLCLGCGYNLETREHMKMVKTVENSGQDQFLWLLPGILSAASILVMIVVDLVWCLFVPEWVQDMDFPFWMFGHKGVCLWVVICSIFGMYAAGRFAIKRLIIEPTAPEQLKS